MERHVKEIVKSKEFIIYKYYITALNINEHESAYQLSYIDKNNILTNNVDYSTFSYVIKLDNVKKSFKDENGVIYHTKNFIKDYNRLSERKKYLFLNRE